MTAYFLGVDIGGSKSHAMIADERGEVLGIGRAGTGNHEAIGFEGFATALRHITDQALSSAGIGKEQISGFGLGIAGYDFPVDHQPHVDAIESLAIPAPYEFVNDAVIGLIAGAQSGWGVSVVAGTGNNCRGRDAQGREGRVAGVGYWTAEHGGGFDLVRKAVQAVAMAWSMRGPRTRLTEKFLNYLGVHDVLDMLEGLSRGRLELSAASVMMVFETAAEGDPVACDVIRWMGRELASLAIGVIRQLHFEPLEFDVVLTGSLYKGSPLITESMREAIHMVAPGARLVPLQAPPVVGAVLLGMEQVNLRALEVRQTLTENAKRHFNGGEGRSSNE
jgi:N-acetylglucosamine kinase-like BadF-type ATPase